MTKINKKDLEVARDNGLIKPEQLEPLWLSLQSKSKSDFDMVKVIYLFGALLIILSMGWFIREAWNKSEGSELFLIGTAYVSGFSYLSYYLFNKKKLDIAAGIVATLAVCLVPIAIFGFQKMTGLWPLQALSNAKDYPLWLKSSRFFLELGVILGGLIMLRLVRYTLLCVPIILSLWYMCLDLSPLIFNRVDFTFDEKKQVSIVFGALLLIITYFWDRRTKLDFAFWGYLLGMLAFWGGISLISNDSEFSKLIYFITNIVFILLSILFERRIFLICGTAGCIGYLSHLTTRVFKDFLSFPIMISIIGIFIIFIGIKYQKNKDSIDKKIIRLMPKFVLNLAPTKRLKA